MKWINALRDRFAERYPVPIPAPLSQRPTGGGDIPPPSCPCLACSHEHTGSFRVRRHDDGSIMVYIPRGGPTFPPIPFLVPAEKVGKCIKDDA